MVIGASSDLGRGGGPDVLGWAPVPRFGLVVLVVGAVAGVSAGVQGLEPVPGGGEILGPGPAGRDLQDLGAALLK